MRTKLYQAKWTLTAASRLARFLEKAFVKRVSLRWCIRSVRCERSTSDVETSREKYYAVLHVGPVGSPRKAVQAAIIQEARGGGGAR